MRGSLVTEVLVQKQNNYLVKEVWEKHYSREQWNRLTSDEKQDFAYKELLSEMAEDMTGCLLRNVVWVDGRRSF
jgi:hypothetical protein